MADVGFQKCSKSGWKIAEFGEKNEARIFNLIHRILYDFFFK